MLTIQIAGNTGLENYVAALALYEARSVLSLDPGCEPGCEGLLLPGGGDIDPSFYRRENRGSRSVDRCLDERQFALLERYRSAGKPVLGICRGHQVINTFFGGDLIQDLPTADRHKQKNGVDAIHPTAAEQGSFLAALYGPKFTTNSSHHQGIGVVGKGLVVVQRADDGVVEGIRHEAYPIFGVQWHPERMTGALRNPDTVDGGALFRYFLSLAAVHRSDR
jgi:putative glutamine amidotransferase